MPTHQLPLFSMLVSLAIGCGPADDGTDMGAFPPAGGGDGAGDGGDDAGSGDGSADDAADDASDDGGDGAGDGGDTGGAGGGDDAPAGSCDFDTDVAIRVTVNVTWEGGLAVLAGGGSINVWLLGQLDQTGTEVHLTGSVCRLELPDFQTGAIAGGETYGTMFPDAVWSSPTMPVIDAIATLSASEPGGSLHLPEGGVVLGAQMADPLHDPWPAEWSGLMTSDHDGDSNAGVTAQAKTGGSYAYPRIDILNSNARAEALYLASRTIMEFDGVIQDCDSAAGDVSMTMENHAVGCKIAGGGTCSAGQTGTLDNNMPVFSVQSGVFSLVRLDGAASCEDVLGALP